MEFNTEKELLDYTQNIIGKTFREIDEQNLLCSSKKDKGILGKVVETGFFKYSLNNNPSADFANLGIELKVAGFTRNKNNTLSSKERISLSKIDYFKIVDEEFEFSKLLFKNKKILIIWYEYDAKYKNDWSNFKIYHYQLYDMSIDEEVFKNDFNIIKNKVVLGQAHNISEGDTSYLGACTKGQKGSDRTLQPNSDELAKPRAFSLKQAYMTGVIRSLNANFFVPAKVKTVEEYILNIIKPYIGMRQIDILSKLGGKNYLECIPKNIGKMISDRLIGTDKELPNKDDLFNKTSYIIKNTSLKEDGFPIERLAFRNLTLSEFEEPWESSMWKTYYEEVTIILICYEGDKSIKNGFRRLKGLKKITFTSDDLEKFKISYNAVRKAILEQDITYLPTPNKFENQILELAPKGVKGDEPYNNFFIKDTTKTCFMLGKNFLYNKIKNS